MVNGAHTARLAGAHSESLDHSPSPALRRERGSGHERWAWRAAPGSARRREDPASHLNHRHTTRRPSRKPSWEPRVAPATIQTAPINPYGRMIAIFVTVNSSIAQRGPSRPMPESFTPP